MRARAHTHTHTPTQVAARALKTLQEIEATAVESKKLDPAAVLVILKALLSEDNTPEQGDGIEGRKGMAKACDYLCSLCSTMISNKNFDEGSWERAVVPYLKPFLGDDSASGTCEMLLERCFKATRPRESQVSPPV